MNDLRQFVMNQPLFETHTHLGPQDGHDWSSTDLATFLLYDKADLETSSGTGELSEGDAGIFGQWPYVRTTGYGQATEYSCRAGLGLPFTADNADALREKIHKLAALPPSGPDGVYERSYRDANVRWSIATNHWHFITPQSTLLGEGFPPFFQLAVQHDDLLCISTPEQLRTAETAFGRSMATLADLDSAMDAYTEKAVQGGRLAAIKIAIAYLRRLDIDDPSYDDAQSAFASISSGKDANLKPLHDYLVHHAIKRAGRLGLVVQIHTGYLNGNWMDVTWGDPSHLIQIFQKYRKNVAFDIFHASWPYVSMACAIGKQFPNVWLDMCWMWALNPAAAERTLDEWLSAVPCNKILAFGADTESPLTLCGYAHQARAGIARVLENKMERGEYDLETAKFVAERVMWKNGCELYGT